MFAVAFIACVLPLVGVTLGQSLKPYTQPWKLSDYKHPPLAIADDRDRSCIFREDNTGPWPFLSVHFTVYDRDWSPYDQAGVKGGCGRGLLDNLRGSCHPHWSCHERNWECMPFNNETTGEHGMYSQFWLVPDLDSLGPLFHVQEGFLLGAHGERFEPRRNKPITCCEASDLECIAKAPGARVEPQLP